MSRRLSDMTLSAVLIIGSIFLWFVADAFPAFERFKSVDSDFWPKMLLWSTGILGALLFLQSFIEYRTLRRAGPSSNISPEAATEPAPRPSYAKLIGTALLVLAYFLILEPVGFLIATLAFLYVAENIPSYSNWKVKALFPPLFTGFLVLFFTEALSLPLPRGTGIFYDISLLLY